MAYIPPVHSARAHITNPSPDCRSSSPHKFMKIALSNPHLGIFHVLLASFFFFSVRLRGFFFLPSSPLTVPHEFHDLLPHEARLIYPLSFPTSFSLCAVSSPTSPFLPLGNCFEPKIWELFVFPSPLLWLPSRAPFPSRGRVPGRKCLHLPPWPQQITQLS